jgi:hypothetical protein
VDGFGCLVVWWFGVKNRKMKKGNASQRLPLNNSKKTFYVLFAALNSA